jgi:mandelamide amidase
LTGAEGSDTALLALALGAEKALPLAPVAPFVQKLANGG